MAEYQNYEQEEKKRQKSKETKGIRLREIYEKIRDEREKKSRQSGEIQLQHNIQHQQQHYSTSSSTTTSSSSSSTTRMSSTKTNTHHKKALLNALNVYQQTNFGNEENEILKDWSEGNDKILSYYNQPSETLSVGDVAR